MSSIVYVDWVFFKMIMNDEWPCDLAGEIFQIANRCTKFRKGFLKNKQKLNFYKLLSLAC